MAPNRRGTMPTLIRLAREAKGIRQLELARRVGVSAGTLSLVEGGLQRPTAKLARRLAAVLGLDVEDLFPELKVEEVMHAD
jgi:transcriptional regulator with XRE-family HTH domain